MLVGYMCASTDGDRQVLDLQRDALLSAGVNARHPFEDRVSGSRGDRAGLKADDQDRSARNDPMSPKRSFGVIGLLRWTYPCWVILPIVSLEMSPVSTSACKL